MLLSSANIVRPAFLGLSSIHHDGVPHMVMASLYSLPEMESIKKYVRFLLLYWLIV